MGWRDEERSHHAAILDATRDVAGAVRALKPPAEQRGYVSVLRVPWQGVPGLALAFRFCRWIAGGEVIGLAQLVKRVPDEHVTVVDGRAVVACLCGARLVVGATLGECSCGRWMFQGREGVYAIRLPEQEAAAA